MHITSLSRLVTFVALAAAIPTGTFAADGFFVTGYGPRQKALAGASVADGRDGMAAAVNPATIVGLDRQYAIGVTANLFYRGYSTTGIGYQYVVNRLNEVLGPGSFRAHRTVTVKQLATAKGRPAFEAICDLTLELGEWVDDKFVVWAEALADGGHTSMSEADARKGAFTNGFKKAAAFFGVGKQAYEGTLDDDNLPQDPVEPYSQPPSMREQVAKAPASAQPLPQVAQVGPEQPMVVARPAPAPAQQRNRLSSRQLGMIWGLARKLGFEQSTFRGQVKTEFRSALEFLTREQASNLIDRLTQKAANGGAHPQQSTDQEHHAELES